MSEPFWAQMNADELELFARVFAFYVDHGPADPADEDDELDAELFAEEVESWAGRFQIEADRVKKARAGK